MSKEDGLESILGTPEEYRAAQEKHNKEKEEIRQRILGKLHKRVVEREDEFRKDFEAQLTVDFRRDCTGAYEPMPVQYMWEGYLMRCQELPSFEFVGAEIRLPADPVKRYHAIDELSAVFGSYVTQMFSFWSEGSGRRVSIASDVERMCVIAHACLNEADYHQFANRLVTPSFRLKALFK